MFRHSTDKKEKEKEDKADTGSSPSNEPVTAAPSPPSAADSPASPSPAAVPATKATPLRSRLGLKFRKGKVSEQHGSSRSDRVGRYPKLQKSTTELNEYCI